MKALLVAAAFVIGLSGAVQALTLNAVDVSGATAGFEPNSTVLPGGASWVTAPAIVGGSAPTYRSPFENAGGTAPATQYFNVLGGAQAELVLASFRSTLSLLWGSVDTYNTVDLYNGAALVGSVTGSAVLGQAISSWGAGRGAAYVTISDVLFNRVVLRSSSNSLEFGAISAVPLPAAGLMLLAALGGLTMVRRRQTAA